MAKAVRPTPVEVYWNDAWIDTGDFERAKGKGVRRTTIGWLIKETDEGVSLATDFYEDPSHGYAAEMFIPWGMIIELWELEA